MWKNMFLPSLLAAAVITVSICGAWVGQSYFLQNARIRRVDTCVSHGGSFIRDDQTAICILPGSGAAAQPVIHDFLARK